MDELTIQVIAGIIVGVLLSSGGFLIKKRFFFENFVLPKRRSKNETESYTHLNGEWYVYYLARNESFYPEPFWVHGILKLKIKGYQIEGSSHIRDYSITKLDYIIKGEIRHGKMILTDVCLQDETDFASMVFSKLWCTSILIGIWIGFDWQVQPTAAPIILSRNLLSEKDLNKTMMESGLNIESMGISKYRNFYINIAESKTKEKNT